LTAQRQHTYLILLHDESIQGDEARRPERDHQLAQVAFNTASDERMRRERVNG
jgi:hypothetical protein